MYRKLSLATTTIIVGGLILSACSSSTRPAKKTGDTQANSYSLPSSAMVQPAPRSHPSPTTKPANNKKRFAGTLVAHNKVRTAHRLSKLTWSDSLASYAQEWANHLASTNNCKMRHRPTGSPYGENLWWASPRSWSNGLRELQDIDIHRVVKDWADEKPFYNYSNNTCQPGEQCGHYTQIVWKETTEVGCAYQQCSDLSQLWVCNYNPPGNYIGERPY